MNKLFDIVAGEVVLNADALAIAPFKTLWDKDTSKTKSQATKEISYIVYMYKWDSIYRSAYSPADRVQKILHDVFGDENYKISDEVATAATRYQELQETLTTRLIMAAQGQLEVLIKLFEESNEAAKNGVINIEPISIIKSMEKMGALVKSLDLLKRQAQLEQIGESRVRGGVEVDVFNTPKTSFIHK